MLFENPTEIELLAYEVGRLSGTERIYGIDHKMDYNYQVGNEIENRVDSVWYNIYQKNPLEFYPEVNVDLDTLPLFDKLQVMNHNRFLDFLIAVNSDQLTHVGSEDGFEGADEAAKYYQRNLRMYTNLNRLDLSKDDRVFILMGASHTAFFRDFISNSRFGYSSCILYCFATKTKSCFIVWNSIMVKAARIACQSLALVPKPFHKVRKYSQAHCRI